MALGAADLTSYDAALKEMWPLKKLDLIFYRDHAFAALVPKVGDFYGKTGAWHNPVSYSPPQGGGGTFAAAQAGKSSGLEVDFVISRKRQYKLFELDNEAIIASEKESGAVEALLQKKSKDAVTDLARNHARWLWTNYGGARGRISSAAAGPPYVITLTNASDAVAFEIDMRLDAATTDGTSGAVRGTVGVVAEVDRDNGTVTLTGGNPGSWAPNDYLFRVGDFGVGYDGILSWLPTDRTFASDPFLTVQRDVDPTRLAGAYHDGRGGSRAEAIKALARKVRINGGGRPDYCFLSPVDFEALELELENTVQRRELTVMPSGSRGARIGFDSIVIKSGNSKVRCLEDLDCPEGVMVVIERDTWKFRHMRGVPHQARTGMGSGNGLAQASSDSVEWRWRIYGNLGCELPGRNGVGLLG